jgi:dihydroorotate dehydrogenase (NAD+) catalytic subunit
VVKPRLAVEIAGVRFRNPVWTASGTFGYGSEYEGLVDLSRIGAVVTKTVTLEPRAGNPPPRIAETPSGMLNSIGLQNVGVEAFVSDEMPRLRRCKTRVVVSVGGRRPSEFVSAVRRLDDAPGIDMYEINISCPNVKVGGVELGAHPKGVARVVRGVRAATERPVVAKLTPNTADVSALAAAAESEGADAVSLINTLVGLVVDRACRRPLLGAGRGGLSGPAIRPVALAAVKAASDAVEVPVVGIGGIATGEDAIDFILCGATCVQVGTATFVNPKAPEEVAEGISMFCLENGERDVRDLVGGLRWPD